MSKDITYPQYTTDERIALERKAFASFRLLDKWATVAIGYLNDAGDEQAARLLEKALERHHKALTDLQVHQGQKDIVAAGGKVIS